MVLGKFWRAKRSHLRPEGSIPHGRRLYAIGDIHGRLDLLDELLAKIDADDCSRNSAHTTMVFLGDLIDRGPTSSQVVERLLHLGNRRDEGTTRFLLGNHEEVFLTALRGDLNALRFFIKIGGMATLLSYGISEEQCRELDYEALLPLLQQNVPERHVDFIEKFEDMIVVGDYAFVHAGVRPTTPLSHQSPRNLRWIRDEFLDFSGSLEKIIVHGHTISDEVEVLPHRIGLDTGAFATDRLSAMGFEGDERWILQTGGQKSG